MILGDIRPQRNGNITPNPNYGEATYDFCSCHKWLETYPHENTIYKNLRWEIPTSISVKNNGLISYMSHSLGKTITDGNQEVTSFSGEINYSTFSVCFYVQILTSIHRSFHSPWCGYWDGNWGNGWFWGKKWHIMPFGWSLWEVYFGCGVSWSISYCRKDATPACLSLL